MGKFLHNGKAVHLRHNDVENHNIRLLIFDYVTDFFSVVCFSDQFKVFIFFDHLTEHVCHFRVIISNCNI